MANRLIKLFFPVLLLNLVYSQHGFTASPPSHDMSSSGMSPQSLIVPQDITPQGVKIKIPTVDPHNNNIITHNINTNPHHSLVIPGVGVISITPHNNNIITHNINRKKLYSLVISGVGVFSISNDKGGGI